MSSGGGKRKAAADLPPSVPIITSAASVRSAGGIKLLIDRSRLGVTSSTVQQKQTPVPVTAAVAGGNVTVSSTAAPNIPTAPAARDTAERGEMRVKVTGEDTNRKSTFAASAVQLVHVKQYPNSLLGRHLSIQQRPKPSQQTTAAANNGQEVVAAAPQYVVCSTADGKALGQMKVVGSTLSWSNLAKSSSESLLLPSVKSSGDVVASVASAAPSSGAGSSVVFTKSLNPQTKTSQTATNEPSAAVMQSNGTRIDGSGKIEMSADRAANKAAVTPLAADQSASSNCPSDERREDVAIATPIHDEDSTSGAVLVHSVAESAESNGRLKEAKQPNTSSDPAVETTGDNTGELMVGSKPSREMKLLKETQIKSKILTEFMNETYVKGKLRKRRTESIGGAAASVADMDTSASMLPGLRKRQRSRSAANPVLADNIGSDNDLGKGSSAPANDRKMRTLNTKSELSLYKSSTTTGKSSVSKDDECGQVLSLFNLGQPKDFPGDPPKPGWDRFCWRCQRPNADLGCAKCVRSYHKLCVRYTMEDPNWSCPECKTTAIGSRPDAGFFLSCLGYALDILTAHFGHIFHPLDKAKLKHYDTYITHHMDLCVMYERLARRGYKALEEFVSDLNWIVHNMSIYNMTGQTELVKLARQLHKRGKREVEEMEPCFECYNNANTIGEDWFTAPCRKPHLLVWAKLKGYPYWPGKLYDINAVNQAHVRFFDERHDRAWVPVKDCQLFSKRDPNANGQKLPRHGQMLQKSCEDIARHIKRLREEFQVFNYAEHGVLVDPDNREEQLRAMLPNAVVGKVTIRRSDGEMVAVASSSTDGTHTLSKAKEGSGSEMVVKKVSPPTNKHANTGKRGSSGKPLTRRMSKMLKDSDETVEEPLADGSKDTTDGEPDSSLSSKNDLKPDSNVTDGKLGEKHKLSEDRDELSLLLRRGAHSWETEPLCKRRKSNATKKATAEAPSDLVTLPKEQKMEKATTAEAQTVTSTNHATETPINANPIQTSTTTPATTAVEKPTVDSSRACVTKSMIIVSIPADRTGEVGALEATSSITLSSSASSPQKSTTESEINIKEETLSDDDRCTFTTEAKHHLNTVPHVAVRSVKSAAQIASVSLPENKITSVSTDSSTTGATTDSTKQRTPSTVNKAVESNGTKVVPSNQLPTMAKTNDSLAKTDGTAIAPGASKQRPATLTNTAQADTIIKAAITVVPKFQLQATLPANKPAKENSSNGGATVPVETAVSNPVLPPITTTLPKGNVSESSEAIYVAPSKQRARKSFPGGAKSAAKQASTSSAIAPGSIPKVSIVHKPAMPSSLPVAKASENAMAAAASRDLNVSLTGATAVSKPSSAPPPLAYRVADSLNRSAPSMTNNTSVSSNGAVFVSKQLIPASTTISLISCADDRESSTANAQPAAAAAAGLMDADNDDVMIIDEEVTQRQCASSSGSLPLPPLVPRPQLRHATRLQSSENGESVRALDLLKDSGGQLVESFCTTIENMLSELAGKGMLPAEVADLKIKLARAKEQNEQLASKLEAERKMYEGMMREQRQTLEQEKTHALSEQRKLLQNEKQRAVKAAKQKQWCKRCFQEAQFYCCWNTSYCDMSCQEKHWDEHKDVCIQGVEKRACFNPQLPPSMVAAVPNRLAHDAHPVMVLPATTTVKISPDTKKNARKHGAAEATVATAATAATTITVGSRGIASPDNGGRKNVTQNATRASPSARGADPNSTSIPNNGVSPVAASTPFPSVARSYPSGGGGTSASTNVSYTTPRIKSVHGGESLVAFQPNTGRNVGNLCILASSSTPNISQTQKTMTASRNKPTQSHNSAERRDNVAASKVSQGCVPTNTYDLTLSPIRPISVSQSALSIGTSSTAILTHNRATAAGDNINIVYQAPWSQMAIENSGIRQSYPGNVGASGQSGVSVGTIRNTQRYPSFSSQRQKSVKEQ